MALANLTNATVLVTGGTDGIGRAAAEDLAGRGATVLLTGRDREKGERSLAAVRSAHAAADGRLYLADFADLDAVRELAAAVREDHDALDVLVNNAGTVQGRRRLTPDGLEYTVAVNHFAPFLLTNLLAPLLRAAAPARVVTVSSDLHRRATLDPATFPTQPDFSGMDAYAASKLANVLFARELADRLDDAGVASNAVHPGAIPSTGLARDVGGLSGFAWRAMGLLPFTDRVSAGGAALAHVAASPSLAGVTGAYFDRQERRSPAPAADDAVLREAFWELSAERTDLPPAVPDVDPLAGA